MRIFAGDIPLFSQGAETVSIFQILPQALEPTGAQPWDDSMGWFGPDQLRQSVVSVRGLLDNPEVLRQVGLGEVSSRVNLVGFSWRVFFALKVPLLKAEEQKNRG